MTHFPERPASNELPADLSPSRKLPDANFISYAFFLCVAFFLPSFQVYLGSLGAIIVNGLLICLIGLYLVLLKKGRVPVLPVQNHFFWIFIFIFATLFVHIPVSILVGNAVGGVSLITRDLFELHRPVLYLFAFCLGYMACKDPKSIQKLEKLLTLIFILLAVFGALQFLRVADPISQLYTKSSNISSRRVAIPFTNPYDFAFVVTFFFFFFFMKMVYQSRVYGIGVFFAAVMLVLPQSRSVVAGFLVGFFVVTPFLLSVFGFDFSRLKVAKPLLRYSAIFLMMFGCLILVLPFLIDNLQYLTRQFIRLIESGDIGNSAGLRLQQFQFALEKAQNPAILFFGNGPAKSEMEFVESIYTYQLYRYGLLGVVLYFLVPLSLAIFMLWKILRRIGRNSPYYALFMAMLIWFFTLPFVLIGNNFTEQVRVSFFYYSLLGVLCACYSFLGSKLEENGELSP